MTILTLPRRKARCSPAFDTLEARSLLSIGLPGDGVLDITFIGDKYTDMGQFHNDVQRVSTALLSYEPFKSRADQIHIHDVDNTVSLGSNRDPSMDRLLYVDSSITTSIVEASGVPTDVIGVLVNDPLYGGSGGVRSRELQRSPDGRGLHPRVWPYVRAALRRVSLRDDGAAGQQDPWPRLRQRGGQRLRRTPPAAAWSSLVAPDEYSSERGSTTGIVPLCTAS